MKISCKELILEITQRGQRHAKQNMSAETMEAVCSRVFKIEHLILTGSEPAFAPEVIDFFTTMAGCLSIQVGRFTVLTNEENCIPAFMQALWRLYRLCTEKQECAVLVCSNKAPGNRNQQEESWNGDSQLPLFSREQKDDVVLTLPIFARLLDKGEEKACILCNRLFVNVNGEMRISSHSICMADTVKGACPFGQTLYRRCI